jgi:hypothetical protein
MFRVNFAVLKPSNAEQRVQFKTTDRNLQVPEIVAGSSCSALCLMSLAFAPSV